MIFFPFLLIWLAPLVVVVWGVVDASSHPNWAWEAAGQSKTLWIVLQVVGLFFCLVGLVLAIVYLAAIAPKVRLAERSVGGFGWSPGPVAGPAPGWSPGPAAGPPPGWYPDPNRPGGTAYWDGTRWTGDAR